MRSLAVVLLLPLGCSGPSDFHAADAGLDAPTDAPAPILSDSATATCKNEVLKWWVATDAGADGTWGTADDTIGELRELHLDENGAIGSIVWHDAAGADAAWDTSDDVIDEANRYEWSGASLLRIWTSAAAGADGVFGTADDPPTSLAVFTDDASGHLVSQAFFGGPGPDGAWQTADDVEQARTTYQFNAAGTDGLLQSYESPGQDGVWGTGDDVIGSAARMTGKTYRVADTVVYYAQPGADGTWGTQDDAVSGVLTVDCSKAVIRDFTGAGPDGTWQTADDVVGSYQWLTGRADCLGVACVTLTSPN